MDDIQYTGFLHINPLDIYDLRILDRVREELQYAESSNAAALKDMAKNMRELSRLFNAAAKRF